MKHLLTISRIVVGVVFVFSGFVKGIDPLGSTYKFIDYFEAFHMQFLNFSAFPLAILLISMEITIGVSLLFNSKLKIVSWILLLFMIFFTILTFVLAITNPVSDCGCFGDAIIMTNWETFYKNLVLILPTILIFIKRKEISKSCCNKSQITIIITAFVASIALSIYNYRHLPIIDFRPYNVGANITEKMSIPPDAPLPEYKTILKYKKDDMIKEFDLNNLPDSSWEWVETENIMISEGYVPPIHDFSIVSSDNDDITDIILSDTKFTFLFIAYDLSKASIKNTDRIQSIHLNCEQKSNCNLIGLTASLTEDIKNYKDKTGFTFTFYNCDPITLKTIIRSNPGLMLIKNGTILGKWHINDLPSVRELNEMFLENADFETNVSDDNAMV